MQSKAEIREAVWRALEEAGAAAFPGPHGRIPNFVGSGRAAELLRTLPAWRQARAVKCNPDYAQRAVRLRALRDGKRVYVAVPRLRGERPFIELDPARLGAKLTEAVSIGGAERLGRRVAVEDLPPIDLIVAGTVAADRTGARIGKGGGYSDLEYALLRAAGKAAEDTVIVTTVHPLQVLDGPLPVAPHDISLDYIVTPEEVIPCRRTHPRPSGLDPSLLSDRQLEEMPAVAAVLAAGGHMKR